MEKPFSYFLQRKGGGARKITPPFTRSRLRHKRKGKRLPFFTDKTHSFLREADVRVHLSFFRKKSVACLPLPLPFPVAPITTSSSSVFPDITKEKSHFLLFFNPDAFGVREIALISPKRTEEIFFFCTLMAFPGNLVRATPSKKKDKRSDYNRGIVSLCNFRNFFSFYGESGKKKCGRFSSKITLPLT